MSGTDVGYAATRYHRTRTQTPVPSPAIVLFISYAMPGTDLGYPATRLEKTRFESLGWYCPTLSSYALAMLCPVLTCRMLVLSFALTLPYT
eukprot:1974557-Rhodomonas_salina.1